MDTIDRPDFIVIGTMKSGTTTLFRWLQEVTGSELCRVKEPRFFSHENVWRRGLGWYLGLFPDGTMSGEASPAYTHPDLAVAVARRIANTLPRTKLVAVLREPSRRLRSHYRHEVQRGRERDAFLSAISRPGSIYVRQSQYDLILTPYLELFAEERLLIVQSEALFGEDLGAWHRLLTFLDVPLVARPIGVHNVTAAKAPYSQLMRRLYDWRIAQRIEALTPGPLKRLAKPLLLKTEDPIYRRLVAQSRDEALPNEIRRTLSEATASLSAAADLDTELWGTPL